MEADPSHLSALIILQIFLLPMETLGGIAFILLLLFLSGLVSGSESAFFSLSSTDYARLAQEGSGHSRRLSRLRESRQTLLATILISNQVINIAIVLIAGSLLMNLMPPVPFAKASGQFLEILSLEKIFSPESLGAFLRFTLIVLIITFVLVLFGEVAPKIYARLNSLQMVKLMSGPMVFLMTMFNPLSRLLVNWTSLIEERLTPGSPASRSDIDEAIELAISNQSESEQEIDILRSLLKFGEVSVKQVMRSRVDVVAVDQRIDFYELLKVVRESGYSRIPVFDSDFDNVSGILYVKDLLGHLHEEAGFDWQPLIRTNVLYVPEAKKINDLLKEFQRQHLHMAIVVDEYGGSSGIVTLEDIMEEVIGEIKDEFDDEAEVIFRKIDDYNFLFEGKTMLNDVCRVIGVDTNTFDEVRGESDSLAGLLLELHGQLPKKDTELSYNQYTFKIVSVSKRRIEQVLLTLPQKVEDGDA